MGINISYLESRNRFENKKLSYSDATSIHLKSIDTELYLQKGCVKLHFDRYLWISNKEIPYHNSKFRFGSFQMNINIFVAVDLK